MRSFKELGIKIPEKGYVGKSIEMHQIFDTPIIVHAFRIEKSKFEGKGNGKCIWMQIELEGEKRVVFTGSGALMEVLKAIDDSKFPFKTTIIKQKSNGRFEFT